jgi:hypothetical protein
MNPALRSSNCPEKQLLALCARTRQTGEQRQEVLNILSGRVDWDYLISESLESSVTPLLQRQLLSLAPESVPIVFQEKLKSIGRSIALRGMFLTAELLRVLDAFKQKGIRAIPYKGPVLAAQAYGDFTLREFEDLDIIVPQLDLPAAHAIVVSFGYKPKYDWILAPDAAAALVPGEYNYRDIPRSAMIELHTERTLRHFPRVPDVVSFLPALVPVKLAEREVPTFAPEELLTLLCIHGSKDFWERLSWIADVSELVQRYTAFDWDRAMQFAESQRALRMVHLGLALAIAIFDTPLLSEIEAQVTCDRIASEIASGIAHRLLSRPFHTLNGRERFRFRRNMQEGVFEGWRYATRLAIVPAEEDWEMVRLPPALAPLYVVLRPIRLLRKYGLGAS